MCSIVIKVHISKSNDRLIIQFLAIYTPTYRFVILIIHADST